MKLVKNLLLLLIFALSSLPVQSMEEKRPVDLEDAPLSKRMRPAAAVSALAASEADTLSAAAAGVPPALPAPTRFARATLYQISD